MPISNLGYGKNVLEAISKPHSFQTGDVLLQFSVDPHYDKLVILSESDGRNGTTEIILQEG